MYTNTVQSLNNIDWKLFELQITLSKYCLAVTDIWMDGRMEKAVPRPASAFSDAGKNASHTMKSSYNSETCRSLVKFYI